jgi:quercetin dioxygenase-like cupin family protein
MRRRTAMEPAAAREGSYERVHDLEKFTGEVWLLRRPPSKDGTEMVEVHFPVGARTHWHMHPAGQLLVVRSGRGLVVPRDGEGQILMPGDIVYAPPGEWHYHGSGPDSPMAHLAVNIGASTAWDDPVTDESYGEHFTEALVKWQGTSATDH